MHCGAAHVVPGAAHVWPPEHATGNDQSVQPEASVTHVCCCPPAVHRVWPSVHWLVQVVEVTQAPPLQTWPGEHVA